MPPRVLVEGLTVEAGDGRRILGPVSFTVEPGEVLLVTGPSGSGKTTLLRALVGSASRVFGLRVQGRVRVDGVAPSSPEKLARIAAYVPQEPWYGVAAPYTVYDLVFSTGLSWREAVKALGAVGLEGKLLEATVWLSAGEAERLLYAEAIASGRKVLLIDEVTSYLDPENKRRVVASAAEAAAEGSAVIVVDHDVRLWESVASKVLYLEKGAARVYDDVREVPSWHALRELEGRLAALRERLGEGSGEELVAVRGVWFRYPDSRSYTVRNVSLEVRAGEIVWVRGGSGRGKSTLLKLIAGIYRPARGRVVRRVEGQLVPENPLLYLSEPTPWEELGGREELLELVGLTGREYTPILHLSSGERRRLAIASAYRRSPRLLLVDEPTVGLDPWNAVKIAELLVELAARGAGVVVATHSREVGAIASRVYEV